MPTDPIYALGAGQITVTGGQLSGETQGDGSHLSGLFITLNSNAWEAIDITETQAGDVNFADSDSSQRLDGPQSFNGVSYSGNQVVEAEYELTLEDPDGNTYTVLGFNINEPGSPFSSFGTVEGLAFVGGVGGFPPIGVALEVVGTREGPSYAYTALATPPCFTPGTWIDTPRGPLLIETLREGDLVMTLDHGAQPIRWIGRTRLPAATLARRPGFRPITVRKGAFGPGHPFRDTQVSPQHRILIEDWRAELYFGEAEVLVAAKKLVNDMTILVDRSGADVEYIHLAFARHELIWGDGLLSESYLPGAPDVPALRDEIRALFADAPAAGHEKGRVARPCITDKSAGLLARA